ncbi:MAG: DNA gyrase subunit A, partial [bacterium]
PPHNLSEVVKAIIFLIDNPSVSDEELFTHVQGPDFPTGGIIYGKRGIIEAYKTGRGIIKIRGSAEIEVDSDTDRQRIIISQIPYQVNKSKLLENIAELINEKKIEGISDLRDESDRDGMRVVIELKKNEIARSILNYLYKHTALESSFGINMVALVQNQPRVLNLREILDIFIAYRKEIVIRRITFELEQAEEKTHILEGLKKAVDNIDRVIEIIRSSKTIDQARKTLMDEFSLSQIQSKSILEMRLQRLTGMEREGLEKDLQALREKIRYYQEVLSKDDLVLGIIKEELTDLQKSYKDERLTVIVDEDNDINFEDTIAEQEMVVTVTHRGYIKRTSLDHYKIQKRRGCGVRGVLQVEEDFTTNLFVTSTHNFLFFFADSGRVFCLKAHQIPETGRNAKGTAIVNLLPLHPEEKIAAFFTFKDLQVGRYLVMATKKGLIKRAAVEEFKCIERFGQRGIRGLTIVEDDKLVAVKMTDGNQDIFLGTKKGKFIRFNEQQIRPTGRSARGSRGIMVRQGDEVVDMQTIHGDSTILTVTGHGFGKRTRIEEYRSQNRGGKGHKNINITPKKGNVIGIKEVQPNETLMIITKNGKLIWIRIDEISVIGRDTQGVKLIELDEEDAVVSVALVPDTENAQESEEE